MMTCVRLDKVAIFKKRSKGYTQNNTKFQLASLLSDTPNETPAVRHNKPLTVQR